MSFVPGLSAHHAIITPTCRVNRGPIDAFDEAVRRLKAQYLACHGADNETANFHVVLTVERPDWHGLARTMGEAIEDCVWEEVLGAVQQAWPTPQTYAESPIELIQRLIDERDEARGRICDSD